MSTRPKLQTVRCRTRTPLREHVFWLAVVTNVGRLLSADGRRSDVEVGSGAAGRTDARTTRYRVDASPSRGRRSLAAPCSCLVRCTECQMSSSGPSVLRCSNADNNGRRSYVGRPSGVSYCDNGCLSETFEKPSDVGCLYISGYFAHGVHIHVLTASFDA